MTSKARAALANILRHHSDTRRVLDLASNGRWPGSSAFVLTAVAGLSKLWISWFNNLRVINIETLYEYIEKNKSLITVANHDACADDPLMWSILKWDIIARRPHLMRWTLAADEICFTTYLTRKFFVLGRCVPVIRGLGIYQKGVEDCLDVLNHNGWVHVFPEGKVNLKKDRIRLKWGFARLVMDADKTPIVLPLWHKGLDDVLPNRKPYIPQMGKNVTVVVGEPINLESVLKSLRTKYTTSSEIRIALVEIVQQALDKVKKKAEMIHSNVELQENRSLDR